MPDLTTRQERSPVLLEVVAEHTGRTVVADDDRLADDLGLDSLAVLDLGMRLEDDFCVRLDDGAITGARTVADLADAVRRAATTWAPDPAGR